MTATRYRQECRAEGDEEMEYSCSVSGVELYEKGRKKGLNVSDGEVEKGKEVVLGEARGAEMTGVGQDPKEGTKMEETDNSLWQTADEEKKACGKDCILA